MVGGCSVIDANGVALPHFLTRHIRLGFDSDDIAALLESIDSSQSSQPHTLPHLPAEILFQILDHVPAYYVLSWRLICRGVRDYIDGPLSFQLLRRAELIGYLGSNKEWPLSKLGWQYDKIHLLRATFERLEHSTTLRDSSTDGAARWNGTHAVFHIDSVWMDTLNSVETFFKTWQAPKHAWTMILERLQLLADEEHYGSLRWCLRLDTAVFDLEFPAGAMGGSFSVDLQHARLMMEWKGLFFRFLKTETLLQTMMKEKRGSDFTFGHIEDCLRAVRRQRLRDALDLSQGPDRRVNWEMSLLRPLFGKKQYDRVADQFDGIERAESDAITVLTTLRRQAAMSNDQIAHLNALARDRLQMENELTSLQQIFRDWKNQLFGLNPMLYNERQEELPKVPYNPLSWSEDIIKLEEERVSRWKTQKSCIRQIAVLLGTSTEVMSLPENAFDDLRSDP